MLFSELALYVLPRALDSLYKIAQDRRFLPVAPVGHFSELLVFVPAMAVLLRSFKVIIILIRGSYFHLFEVIPTSFQYNGV
jgi:hypothetical protein